MTAARDAWKRLGRLAVLPGLLLLVLYGNVLAELVQQWWKDPDYSHAFLVPLFSGFLVWRVRRTLVQIRPERSWAGLALLVAGCASFLLGAFAAEYFTTRASLVLVLAGLTLFLFGLRSFRLLAFPIAYLAFMVPLPAVFYNAVSFPLQREAAQAAASALELLHIPVLLEGNVIHLSKVSLGVTEACSGLRSLMALVAATAAWAYLGFKGLWPRILLVALSVPVALGANMLRVIITAIIAQRLGARYAQGFFHGFSGWLVFLFAFGCLAGLSLLLRRLRTSVAPRDPGPTSDLPDAPQGVSAPTPLRELRWRTLLGSLPLLVTLLILVIRLVDDSTPLQKPLDSFPLDFGRWHTRDIFPLDRATRADLAVSDAMMRLYADDSGSNVWLFVAYWKTQRRGATMHSPKNCLPGDGWDPVDSSRIEVTLGGERPPIVVNRYLVEKNGRRQVVFYWYDVKGQVIAGEVRARLAMAKNSMLLNRTDGALVRVSIPVKRSAAEAAERLASFTRDIAPLLDEHFVR